MIPNENSTLYNIAKFSILETGDIIEEGDEYYNPIVDKWIAVLDESIGLEWNIDYYKPFRRKIKR